MPQAAWQPVKTGTKGARQTLSPVYQPQVDRIASSPALSRRPDAQPRAVPLYLIVKIRRIRQGWTGSPTAATRAGQPQGHGPVGQTIGSAVPAPAQPLAIEINPK